MDPTVNLSADEIDISNFPKWSRGWYNSNNSKSRPEPDIYTPLPTSHLNSAKKQSPFDPGYVHDSYGTYNSDPYNAYDLPPPLSSLGGDSRDMLPWSNDPPEYGPPLDPMLKEERMRMLEREFGNNGKKKGKDLGKSLVDEDGKPLVGTVDEKGNLVTSGPKRRIAFRALQIILAIGACIPAIYAAVVSILGLVLVLVANQRLGNQITRPKAGSTATSQQTTSLCPIHSLITHSPTPSLYVPDPAMLLHS